MPKSFEWSGVSDGRVIKPESGRRNGHRALGRILLGSVSAAAMFVTGNTALARPVGSGANGSAATTATNAAQVGAAQAAALARQSQQSLSQAAQAIRAMQQVQANARAAALAKGGAVSTNGLGTGGLLPDTGMPTQSAPGSYAVPSSWKNIGSLSQSTSNGQTTVNIDQSSQYAILNWASFNVSAGTIVNFNQGGSDWSALNRITAGSQPSVVDGQIRAPGQVLIINPNGIIFTGTSQINVGSLIASSLDITSQTNFLSGTGFVSTGNSDTTPSFQTSGSSGAVTVQAGAQLNGVNGNVLLLGPTVENDGTISTPGGQTLLLGGSDVLLANGDANTRGFVVSNNPNYPNSDVLGGNIDPILTQSGYYASQTPGTAINNGLISAPRGNITIVAGRVNQSGILTSTTSTTSNGSIVIWAETGALVLGGTKNNPLYASYGVAPQPSLVQILPEAADQTEITDTQVLTNSAIALNGTDIDIGGIVQLRGYDVTNANNQLALASGPLSNTSAGPRAISTGVTITATGSAQRYGQVLLENGSVLDTAGTTDAVASASRNSVAVELRVNELADSPLLRSSALYQQTIYVDATVFGTNPDGTIWQGTAIANASGWIAQTQRSLDERFMNGAPITIGGISNAANILQENGSIIKVSGGYTTYMPGFVRVSSLIDQYGRAINVGSADPNQIYLGACCSFTVYHSAQWDLKKVGEIFASPFNKGGYFDPGYVQGGAAGSLYLDAAAAVLAGQVYASVVAGDKQRTSASEPAAAQLTINGVNPISPFTPDQLITGTFYSTDQITISNEETAAAAKSVANFAIAADDDQAETMLGDLLPKNTAGTGNTVYLPSSWLNSGFGAISLAANAKILLGPGNDIKLPTDGSLTAKADAVLIQSSITAPSGTITLPGAFTFTSVGELETNPNDSRSIRAGLLSIASGIVLSTAGLWTNDFNAASPDQIDSDGGTITLGAYGDIELGKGSVLDVSAGAYETARGKITMGGAGKLTLAAGLSAPQPKNGDGVQQYPSVSSGTIHFDGGLQPGQLRGYGNGGSLALTSYAVATIVPASQMDGALLRSDLSPGIDALGNLYAPLAVSTDFFFAGGFASISLTAAGIDLPANVMLAPTVTSQMIRDPKTPSAGSLAGIAVPVLLPAGSRPAISISLEAAGDLWNRGGKGATGDLDTVDIRTYSLDIAGSIVVDPKGAVSLTGDQIAIVSGSVVAPGGSIALGGGTYTTPAGNPQYQEASPFAALAPAPLLGEGVWLTSTGQLSAAGVQTSVMQSNGLPFRDVLPGGQVTVSGGDIVLARGSLIDVSGAAGQSSLSGTSASAIAPSGASLSRSSPFAVASDGGAISISVLLGAALEGTLLAGGGADAVGGTLNVTMASHGSGSYSPGANQPDVRLPANFWPRDEITSIVLQSGVGDSQLQPGSVATADRLNAVIPLSAAMIAKGGFSSLTLNVPAPSDGSPGVVSFDSGNDVSLTLPGQIAIHAATIVVPTGRSYTIGANYVLWQNDSNFRLPALGGAIDKSETNSLTIIANTIDLIGDVAPQGARKTTIDASGDLRLTGFGQSGAVPLGSLMSAGDLVLAAGQIYPSTHTNFTLASLTSVTVLANGAPPPVPLSAGGVLNVVAPTINQSGTLRAPMGTINLGAPKVTDILQRSATGVSSWTFSDLTQNFMVGQKVTLTSSDGLTKLTGIVSLVDNSGSSHTITVDAITFDGDHGFAGWTIDAEALDDVTLGKGSLTSVSAAGEVIPYGYASNSSTLTANTTWYYNPTPGNTFVATALAAPPNKIVAIAGNNISVSSQATIDESGGGDLYASEFVPGTGGSKNIFGGSGVFAVLPGYGGITPFDPDVATAVASIGRKVYLNGVPGLPAGVYTVMPGQYGELPGAFLVTVQSAPGAGTAASTRAPLPKPAVLPDGSSITSGYFIAVGSSAADEHWSVFKVMSGPVARQYTQIVDNFANTFFPAVAAVNGTAVPRLPIDAGQLILAANASLTFQGTGHFRPAPGGHDGLVDITGNQILVVDTATRDLWAGLSDEARAQAEQAYVPLNYPDPWNPLVLSAGDLSDLGVGSLLLGGIRSFQSDGEHLMLASNAIVIANDARDPLTLPDIAMVASPRLVFTTVGNPGQTINLASAVQETGQVYIYSNAVIHASGAYDGGESSLILPVISLPKPGVGEDTGALPGAQVQAFYQAVAEDQVAYARVSDGGLVVLAGNSPSFAGFATGRVDVDQTTFDLPLYATNNGTLTVGAGAQLIADNSVMLYANASGRISAGIHVSAATMEVRSGSTISLGSSSVSKGIVLDQGAIDSLSSMQNLLLVSAGEIDIHGDLSFGRVNGQNGQPTLGSLTLDSAGLVEQAMSGLVTFTAEQVTLQNTLGGTIMQPGKPGGAASLTIEATEAAALGSAQISLGSGAVSLAGFSGVLFKSDGRITVTGDGGSLASEQPLTLDAPRIDGGAMTMTHGLPQFSAAAYTINAEDNPATPSIYYAVNLVNSSGATPALPAALLGNGLTIKAADIDIATSVVLPGGAFNATANNGGNITVEAQGNIDVSGQAISFVDVLASIGGGNIMLNSTRGAVVIRSGAILDVGDSSGAGALNQTTAGTLTLAAPVGGLSIAAGTLRGEGPGSDPDGSASFVLDTNTLASNAALNYDTLASMLIAGGFAKSWDIRAHSGDIRMEGTTLARNVTVSADTGGINVVGSIDAHGATPGQIALWAGTDLIVEASAHLDARGATADANGRGGQVILAASQAGNQQGSLILEVGASIDVTADAPNANDSGPVFGGQVTFVTSRTAANDGVLLQVRGGSLARFLSGVKGESAWDGIVVVGNQTYTYDQASLVITPFISQSDSVVFNAFLTSGTGYGDATYSAAQYDAMSASNFMSDGNQSAMWSKFGADGNGVAGGVLVNIRPGVVIKNSGSITIEGDSQNPNGIDLSGSAYSGSVLNTAAVNANNGTNDNYSLNGHFGQYDEPLVLAIRAAGNLNFGSCTGDCLTATTPDSAAALLTLGGLSDGFWQYYAGPSGTSPLYPNERPGGGASGAATLFDPAASGAYNGLSRGLGADSATFYLTAGADIAAAKPNAVVTGATGTLTVAGIPGTSALTADPLYVYNFDSNGGVMSIDLGQFVDYASLIRTGTGNITIATAKDLVLQSPLSLIYTAGTGYNVNGSSDQPLSGFTQYNGMLKLGGFRTTMSDSLPTSIFPTHGGDVALAIGGDIVGAMNPTFTTINFGLVGVGTDQELPYDMTALGSQAKLQNMYSGSTTVGSFGAFSALYVTDSWLTNGPPRNFYTFEPGNPTTASGTYQLGWYIWLPYLENTIGSFGGGNISVRAGGSISQVQFVSPTNARDAGPALVGTRYAYDPNLVTNPVDVALFGADPIVGGYSGLYVQGGGNVSVTAGGNISNVYTYVQNGKTTLSTGLSATGLALETSTGDVSVSAGRMIGIADQTIEPSRSSNHAPVTLSGLSLIQNGNFLIDIANPASVPSQNRTWYREINALSGILTSVPNGSVSLRAVGDINFDVGTPLATAAWNTMQGVLPAQFHAISLQGSFTFGDTSGGGRFITYPDPAGTIDMLARVSVTLNSGFVLSDANPGVMPTLANIAAVFSDFNFIVTSSTPASSLLTPAYGRIDGNGNNPNMGGANFLSGQDPSYSVLNGDNFEQLRRDFSNLPFLPMPVSAGIEADRHDDGRVLHAGDTNPARIIALDGDVVAQNSLLALATGPQKSSTILNFAKAVQIYAGRDVANLALLGQNNNDSDVTSVVAGRDVTYRTEPVPLDQSGNGFTSWQPSAIEIGGPGNLVVESGRNVDLGTSTGFLTLGNALNPSLKTTAGASITVETGLGAALTSPDYANFIAQYVNPATADANLFAEPLQLFDGNGKLIGSSEQAFKYLSGLPRLQQQVLLNRIFFGLVRDSGREHTGASGGGNYENSALPSDQTIDTAGMLNTAYADYQRANAAIGTFLGNTSVAPYGSGDFLGGLSTVRTLSGGAITVLSPHGQIEVGLVTPPQGFNYAKPGDPLWALGFGIVSEKGGDVDLYARGDILVNQSRVFTLEGGDITIISQAGNIDAGKGAKTVQAVQPPSVKFDPYGNITITPYGPASGSGIAVLRALPSVRLGNADLIAPRGSVNAGDAGIRVSGNLNVAAVQVLNAANIQVGGTVTGVPTFVAPSVDTLSTASNAAGAAAKIAEMPTGTAGGDRPSIIIVEFLGFGGGDEDDQRQRPRPGQGAELQRQDPSSPVQVIGGGVLTPAQQMQLTETERRRFAEP